MADQLPILQGAQNPQGYRLEELLALIIVDLKDETRRAAATDYSGDPARQEVQSYIVATNDFIVKTLAQVASAQRGKLARLDTLGPDPGPTGIPRI